MVNKVLSNLSLMNFVVPRSTWESCSGISVSTISPVDLLMFDNTSVGSTYIVQTVGVNGINFCELGLKVNITVQNHSCALDGETNFCSGHGTCSINTLNELTFTCDCEYGYYGERCEEFDACVNNPCANGGNCSDVIAGLSQEEFQCNCLDGYSGIFV